MPVGQSPTRAQPGGKAAGGGPGRGGDAGPSPPGSGGALEAPVQDIRQALGGGDDIQTVWLQVAGPRPAQAALVYLRGLADEEILKRYVIAPLARGGELGTAPGTGGDAAAGAGGGRDPAADLRRRLAPVNPQPAGSRDEAVQAALSGDALLLVAGAEAPWMLRAAGWKERPVMAPSTESSMRGARESFTENLEVNVALVRRRMRDPRLVVQETQVGTATRTRVDLLYMQGVAPARLLQAVRSRLDGISVDALRDSGELCELLCAGYLTPFPLVMSTERPDRVVDALVAGKGVLLVDGSPWAVLLPVRLIEYFFSVDDYFMRPPVAVLLRLARLMAWAGIVLFPALYVSLEAYNPDVLRAELVLTMDTARSGVPLTVVFELLFLIVMVELIQEAAARLPEKIGGATTIVGALIIGEAVARARIVSDTIIVITAMGTIGSLTFPDREIAAAWRISSGLLVLCGALFGLFGVFLGLLLLTYHLNALEPFGEPYLYPLAPLAPRELLRDGLFRLPKWMQASRPDRGPRRRMRR